MDHLFVEVDGVLHFTYAADLRDYHLIIEALGEKFEGDNNNPHSLTSIMNSSEFEHFTDLLRLSHLLPNEYVDLEELNQDNGNYPGDDELYPPMDEEGG